MKKRKVVVSLLTTLMLLVTTVFTNGVKISAGSDDLLWKLYDDTGELRIYTSGTHTKNIPDYTSGHSPWYDDASVKEIIISWGIQKIGNYAFQKCTGAKVVSIPSSVTEIGKYAFVECTGLDNVVIPSSIEKIYEHAFDGCSNVTSVLFEGNTAPIIAEDAFNGVSEDCLFYVYAGLQGEFKDAGIPEEKIVIYHDPIPRTTAFSCTEEVSESYLKACDHDNTKAEHLTAIFEEVQRGIECESSYRMLAYYYVGKAYFDATYTKDSRYELYNSKVRHLLDALKDITDEYYAYYLGTFGGSVIKAMYQIDDEGLDKLEGYYNIIFTVLADEEAAQRGSKTAIQGAEASIGIAAVSNMIGDYAQYEDGILPISNYLIGYLANIYANFGCVAEIADPMISAYCKKGSELDKFIGAANILLDGLADYNKSEQRETIVDIASGLFGAIANNSDAYDTIIGSLNIDKGMIKSLYSGTYYEDRLAMLPPLMNQVFANIAADPTNADKYNGFISNIYTNSGSFKTSGLEMLGAVGEKALQVMVDHIDMYDRLVGTMNTYLGINPNASYSDFYSSAKLIGISLIDLIVMNPVDADYEKVQGAFNILLSALNTGTKWETWAAIGSIGTSVLEALKTNMSDYDLLVGDMNILLSGALANIFKADLINAYAHAFIADVVKYPTLNDKFVSAHNILMSCPLAYGEYENAVSAVGYAFFNFKSFDTMDFDKLVGYMNIFLSWINNNLMTTDDDDIYDAVRAWVVPAFKAIDNNNAIYDNVVGMTNSFMSTFQTMIDDRKYEAIYVGYYALNSGLCNDSEKAYRDEYLGVSNILFTLLNDEELSDAHAAAIASLGGQWLADIAVNHTTDYENEYNEKFSYIYASLKDMTSSQIRTITNIGCQWLYYLPLETSEHLDLYNGAFEIFLDNIKFIREDQLNAYETITRSMLGLIYEKKENENSYKLTYPLAIAEINAMSADLSDQVAIFSKLFFKTVSDDVSRSNEYLTYNKNVYEAIRIDALLHVAYDCTSEPFEYSYYWCGTYMDVCDDIGDIYPGHEGTFTGWSERYSSTEFDFSTRITDDVYLYSGYYVPSDDPPGPGPSTPTHTLTIKYSYPDGTTYTYTKDIEEGAAYSVKSKVFEGYTANHPTVSGTMGTSNITVQVTYTANKYTLTIEYVYPDGTKEKEEYDITYGEEYNIPVPEVEGHTADKEYVSGTMGANDTTETVTYTKNKYVITVEYQYPDGTKKTEEFEVEYGQGYNIPVPEVEGYEPNIQFVTGTMGAEDITVVVVYTKIGETGQEGVDGPDGTGENQPGTGDSDPNNPGNKPGGKGTSIFGSNGAAVFGDDDWSLVTLISTIASLLTGVALPILNKKKGGKKSKGLIAIGVGVASVALFVLTQNLSSTMKIVDETTIPAVAIALGHIVNVVFNKTK